MATVTKTKPFNHEETQRRVRSPLMLVRKYIRAYIILEGLVLVGLAAVGLFWLGLLCDFGLDSLDVPYLSAGLVNAMPEATPLWLIDFIKVFGSIKLFGVDWLLELNDMDPTGAAGLVCRIIVLLTVVIGLVTLGFMKVGLRWFREFNDRAIALVLERRFPKELGDRLITAVELADPKLSKKYGYSQAMVEKTILDAVEALKKLPVAGVFNWRRLTRLWVLLGAVTLGVWLFSMALLCVTSQLGDAPLNPYTYSWKFFDTASIWTERNILMRNTYWPRRAYLEIGRFQPSALDKNDMRVPLSDERPALTVRAYEWVIADRKATYGWRPLMWKDLSEHKLVDAALLARVKIPGNFAYWQIDPEELEPNFAAALFGTDTRMRPSSEVNEYLDQLRLAHAQADDPSVPWEKRRAIKAVQGPNSSEKLVHWLDWSEWTVDKLGQQKEDAVNVRPNLRILVDGQDQYQALEEIFSRLEELAEAPSMGRTLRKLDAPDLIAVSFRGAESNSFDMPKWMEGNKYEVPLKALENSPKFRFRARGANYFTPPKTITLVAAPAPKTISIDKDEPAYIYHRLHELDQAPLKGVRHVTRDLNLPITGDTNTIEVPLGSDLTIHVRTDRKLRPERSIDFSKQQAIEPGYDGYRGAPPVLDADQNGFKLVMKDLARKHDFSVEFYDEDNIRGRRRFKILSVIDMEAQVGNLNITGVLLRKPKFKAPAPPDKEKDKDAPQRDYKEQAELAGAYLITPDALLPFECPVKDDYGLTGIGYNFKIRKADVELMSQGGDAKVPVMQVDQVTRRANAALVASNFQFLLGNPLALSPGALFGGQYHLAYTTAVLREELRRTQGYREAHVSCDAFKNLLERKFDKMIYLDTLKDALKDPEKRAKLLAGPRSSQTWEFDFKEDDGFDLRKHLPELKAVDAEKAVQYHYYLQIAVQAVDNNVETGQHLDDKGLLQLGNKKTNRNGFINFLVISENELLTQISLEEESISEKIEGAKEKVDAGIVSLRDQLGKVADPKTDMDNVLNRMNEIRTALASAGNTLRDSHKAYENIVREMEVNRVKSDRMAKIKDRIVAPLKDIVLQDRIDDPKNPQTGSYPYAEDAFQNAHQLVEDDVNQKREPNYAAHREAMTEADRKLRKLSLDLKYVLDAMKEGIDESKLIAFIAAIEANQRSKTQLLDRIHAKNIEDALKELLDPGKKSPPPKQEEKKSSQRRLRPGEANVVMCDEVRRAGSVSDGFSGASSVAYASGSLRWQNRKAHREEHPAVLSAPSVLNCKWGGSALRQSTA